MQRSFDPSAVRLILRRLIASHENITIETFDQPPPGWFLTDKDCKKNNPLIPRPPYRNLLRDGNPQPTVEFTNPRDFDSKTGLSSIQRGEPQISSIDRWDMEIPPTQHQQNCELNDSERSRHDQNEPEVLW